MQKYEIALFDLDGTLSESAEGILECVRSIFIEMNKPMPDEESVRAFIGPPMYDSLKRVGFSEEESQIGVAIYKKNFSTSGIFKNRVYDGMMEVLKALKEKGVRLGVASTKYQQFTDKIIDMLCLREFFGVVGGSTALSGAERGQSKPRHDKADVIEYVVESLRETDNDRVVMIGDTKYDADGAARAGYDFIGCLYGYGTKQEMLEHYTIGTPIFVSTPAEITGHII